MSQHVEICAESEPAALRSNEAFPEMSRKYVQDSDTIALARSGKKQVLTRRFGLVSMTGFCCSVMGTWEGMLVTIKLGYANGGPAGLIYGFFITWLGTLSVFIVMGELASMIPTAGGQYHWVSILAPKSAKLFLSYVAGWLTVAGWVAATTAISFWMSSMVQAMLMLNLDGYDSHPDSTLRWHGTLLYWAALLTPVLINTALSKALPAIEVLALILRFLGFFGVIVPLNYLAPRASAATVFTTFKNTGGWNSQGLAFFIGLNGLASAFVGTDGPIHMSEEVQNAAKNVPRSMIISTLVNGVLAFGMLLTLLFHIENIEDAMINAPNGFIFVRIFEVGVGSKAGATVLTSIIMTLVLCTQVAGLASASRMMWSFARDRGLPWHSALSKVDRRTTIPLTAVMVVFCCSALVGLINIGNSTAFGAITSMLIEGFYSSYLLACAMLLYRRLRGDIREPDAEASFEQPYRWGPWRLKGYLGIANNVLACAYLLLVVFFAYWPTTVPVDAVNMNYSSLVLGAVALFSIVYYLVWARKTYKGPVVEVRVASIQPDLCGLQLNAVESQSKFSETPITCHAENLGGVSDQV